MLLILIGWFEADSKRRLAAGRMYFSKDITSNDRSAESKPAPVSNVATYGCMQEWLVPATWWIL